MTTIVAISDSHMATPAGLSSRLRDALKAADLIIRALERTIANRIVTYDFARLMEGAREVKCSEFATALIERMGPE